MTEEQLWDAQRQQWVISQPEERLRQFLVHFLISELGYPRSLILVEKSLQDLPHLQESKEKFPPRRVDILCYTPGKDADHPLQPLLLIECKAVPLNARARQQVTGYNHFVGAAFLALANEAEMEYAYYSTVQQEYCFQKGLPAYSELVQALTPT